AQVSGQIALTDCSLLIGINSLCCRRCYHCMVRGTWNHAPNRAFSTTGVSAYFHSPRPKRMPELLHLLKFLSRMGPPRGSFAPKLGGVDATTKKISRQHPRRERTG